MPSNKRCSLRDIARASGYSPATVSLALRDLARVPMATRARIHQVAQELGYVRDAGMSRIMSQARRSGPVAVRETLVFLSEAPIAQAAARGAPWLEGMFQAARSTAHRLGYEMEAEVLGPSAAAQRALSRKLWSRGIRGLIVGPITLWTPGKLAFDWPRFATVELGSTLPEPALHRVERSFYDDLLELYAHLHALGYRRIGLGLSRRRLAFMRHEPEAALLLLEKNHPEMQHLEPLHSAGPWEAATLHRWLRRERPDVVMVYETEVAGWIADLKIRVPRDLGVAYLSGSGGAQSGLAPDIDLLAKEATHLLSRLVESGEWGLSPRARSHRFRNLFNPGATIRRQTGAATPTGL